MDPPPPKDTNTSIDPLPFGDPCRDICDPDRITPIGIMKSFYKKYPALSASLFAVSLIGPFNSIISPLFIGRLSDGISRHDVKKTSIYIGLLVVINIAVLALYNLDLYTAQKISCKIATHIQMELLSYYFDTHESGTVSSLDDNVTRAVQIFIESMLEFIDIVRNIIGPALFSLFLQAAFLGFYIDIWLGVVVLGVFLVMVVGILYSINYRSCESKNAVVSDIEGYGIIEDLLDNFLTVVITKTGQYKELKALKDAGDKKCYYKVAETVRIIKFVACMSVVIVALSVVFGIRYYYVFIHPYTGERRKVTEDAEKKETEETGNTSKLTEKAVSSVAVFFGVLSGVRSMFYYVYFLGDAMERIRVTTEVLNEGSICNDVDGGGCCGGGCSPEPKCFKDYGFPTCGGTGGGGGGGVSAKSVGTLKGSSSSQFEATLFKTISGGLEELAPGEFEGDAAIVFSNVTYIPSASSKKESSEMAKRGGGPPPSELSVEDKGGSVYDVQENFFTMNNTGTLPPRRAHGSFANPVYGDSEKTITGMMLDKIGIKRSLTSIEKLQQQASDDPIDGMTPGGYSAPKAKEITGADGVALVSGKRVFDNLSFVIPKGGITAIVGRNGCGKSTAFNLVMGFISPRSGSVSVNGETISNSQDFVERKGLTPSVSNALSKKSPNKTSVKAVREQIAYSNQFASMFDRPILDNLIYPNNPNQAQRKRVWGKIVEFGLENVYKKFESGLDTMAGRRGERLSGGQRQIVQLTKILLRSTESVILLDEVTASVDAYHRQVIIRLLKSRFFLGKTVVIITHDPELLEISKYRLDLGRVNRV